MNLFELFVKIGVDDKASKQIANISGKLGSGLKTAAKIGTAAVTAAVAGIASLTAAAINNFAEYEQLVGGVETLFKDSADKVAAYAAGAYKTAGMSANDYMETVTSFSASLLQSLENDTVAAAEYADMAITDMSDNANKMGTAIEMIQNAYQGFAKQNYTMLDNLKLGYGGTKTEMERLIKDANAVKKANGELADLSINSFADIVEAIHIIQDEMGITGTTAEEAATTISGSLSSVKAAWSNLMTGVADDTQDFDTLVDNFVESVEIFGENIGPRVETAVSGVVTLVSALLPGVLEALPGIIEEGLPTLTSAATEIIGTVVPELLDALVVFVTESSDDVAVAAVSIIESLLSGLSEHGDELLEAAFGLINTLVGGIDEFAPELAQTAVDLLVSLGKGLGKEAKTLIPAVVDIVLTIAEVLTEPENISDITDAAVELIFGLAEGLIEAVPMIVERAPEIVANLAEALISESPQLLGAAVALVVELVSGLYSEENALLLIEGGGKIIEGLIQGFKNCFSQVWNIGGDIFEEFKDGFMKLKDDPIQWGKDLIDNFIQGIKDRFSNLTGTISDVAQSIRDLIGFSEPKKGPLSNFHTYAPDMMDLFAQGIKENEKTVTDQIESSFDFGKRTIDADFAIDTTRSMASEINGTRAASVSSGGITVNITVNGANYNNEETLAEAIAEQIQRLFESRGMIYA